MIIILSLYRLGILSWLLVNSPASIGPSIFLDLGRLRGLRSQGKAEWAIDSEAMRARRIIVLVKSN